MTDIALIPLTSDGRSLPGFDIAMSGADLQSESGLQTAIIISLFSDAPALPDDVIPDGSSDRRGWWADALAEIADDRLGSRLWLLAREKQTPATLRRAQEYAEEALQWLIDDGVAASVAVSAEWVRAGILGLSITIARPSGNSDTFRYQTAWENTIDAV